ncbi:rRNA pseudouridine synthase [Alicyclobacillus cycloheptanicus]|uniref:Pseudouridine synthase n=1 Tax=Alicyclobacillus cycloheptanicus TaxID=1457 RepID=A0ABT9XF42_9BACL|nr:pseudouridine synthase [Alicyclobacillus cycloheptanicus]MDQ0188448.1 23S rRNA pseudouridine2605 synthase [Alicyclobacillus cycloheptanicus]WDM01144.1 rRNA pseudouridine synthase [Alicyclobacillus cycloheptanicus]
MERSRTTEQGQSQPERLQKVLAQAGVASRRRCEEIILAGRVTVDGQVCTVLGTKVNPSTQRIEVDGQPIQAERRVAVILHKPTSYVTTVSDPEGRRTVMELLKDIPERLFPVGRLDYDTTGLLLLSNDGELANRLLHPRHHVDKVYRVTVLDMPDKETIARLEQGVALEDGMTQPATVRVLRMHPRESVLELTIREGRNRQVRRMFEAVGLVIKRLKRVKFGVLELGDVAPGDWRLLSRQEWTALYESVGLTPPAYPLHLAQPEAPAAVGPARSSGARGYNKRGQHAHARAGHGTDHRTHPGHYTERRSQRPR